MTQKLYTRVRHPHKPRNVNDVHADEQTSFNARIAVWLTEHVGTMWTAYAFAVLAIIGLFAILGLLSPVVVLLVAWLSQTFIQLVLLPVIMVGQNVLSRHSELLAEEQYATTQHSFHDIEEIMKHLDAQDAKILELEQTILKLSQSPDTAATVLEIHDMLKEAVRRGN